ncbi:MULTISPECIES: chromosome partitioning protein ParA [Aestuariibaculum]|uniref:Chromosome partitioning protein ParA n=1 Tax=Aestuariibaculum lutulentum TaxID=2920935 RepID=A0ABS9RI58_9FLAO|nr:MULTISPECIES: chromosome partitioning protein ParA [Aestuariibaculum]MCH4552632.1 chromosome partitioning protein ParA [Aestuariibaculum lutulentum]MCR8668134.1 chromosome partitioning protein ParA [Aestuariibaculum sp. M13]
MENNKSSIGLKVALGIAVVLFLGMAFYSMNLYQESNKVQQDLTEEKQKVMDELSLMASQYDEAIGENEVANQNLIEARARIQGLMDSLKISETNVKSLWRYKQKYASLQKEMDVLLAQNDSLKVSNAYLATSLDSTRVRLEERTMFNDSLLLQNTALAEVVSNAAVLSAVDLKASGVIVRTSGKVIPTERAGRSDKIRVCFIVAKNKLVQAGDQELYIQVIDPKNNIIGLNEQVQFDEVTLNYSLISKFNYENANLNVCEFIAPRGDEDFDEGRYIVNVFNEKDLVSTSEFTLK